MAIFNSYFDITRGYLPFLLFSGHDFSHISQPPISAPSGPIPTRKSPEVGTFDLGDRYGYPGDHVETPQLPGYRWNIPRFLLLGSEWLRVFKPLAKWDAHSTSKKGWFLRGESRGLSTNGSEMFCRFWGKQRKPASDFCAGWSEFGIALKVMRLIPDIFSKVGWAVWILLYIIYYILYHIRSYLYTILYYMISYSVSWVWGQIYAMWAVFASSAMPTVHHGDVLPRGAPQKLATEPWLENRSGWVSLVIHEPQKSPAINIGCGWKLLVAPELPS